MSAPLRGPHGGGSTSGRSTPPPGSRGRGTARGSAFSQSRGRGTRGRAASSTSASKAEGVLQGLQSGTLIKRGGSGGSTQPGRGEETPSMPYRRLRICSTSNLGARLVSTPPRQNASSLGLLKEGRPTTPRGTPRPTRGRGATASTGNILSAEGLDNTVRENPSHKDFMAEMTTKFQMLKQKREGERAKAIRDGFLADPEKKTSLDKAITPVGTCTNMCPEFERVERIVQNMVEKPEKVIDETTGRDVPAEERMVKRFRRSAAGYDEQLPSDIRTPATLQATLNYLLNDVVGGGEQLATVHKFVWDRTRGIRNDFSIQQVSKDDDVKLAVDCFERIARLHILSLHQLSNPDHLTGDGFDAHQEREQLNNTLLSLMYYYDDNRNKQIFPNEAEFRAYCIIFELQSSHPDLEDRMQSWPPQLLTDKRVQTAFRLYSAATNTLFEQGPLKPTAPFSIAQGNTGAFWKLLKSKAVSYVMSCVAEIHFGQLRYMTLQNLWESHKGPSGQQIRNQEWTLDELTNALAFDDDEETLDFCQGYGLEFKTNAEGIQYLDFTSHRSSLDQSSTPRRQIFSHNIVEAKRYRRSLVAVINGIGVARAIREGLVEADSQEDGVPSNAKGEDSREGLFFPENGTAPLSSNENKLTSIFNPQASIFTPGAEVQPSWSSSTTSFGKPSVPPPSMPASSSLNAPTGIPPSGFTFSSSLPSSSTKPLASFDLASTSFLNSFTPERRPTTTSSTAIATSIAPFTFPAFSFGQPRQTASPPTGTSSAFSFGKPSAVLPTFNQSTALHQQDGQQQSESRENSGDATFFPRPLSRSLPTTSPNDVTEVSSPSISDNKGLEGSPLRDSTQSWQNHQEAPRDRQSVLHEALLSPRVSQPELEVVNDGSIPPKLPPSLQPAKLVLSEDFARPTPPSLPPNTGSDFGSERAFTASNNDYAISPRNITDDTQPPGTAVFAPRQPLSSDSNSKSPSIQPAFSWTVPAPPGEGVVNQSPSTRPKSPSLLPSQYPAPPAPPKQRKVIQPKVKELKAVSAQDPTPRDSSPLRERPVIFGDNANAFRQSAAFAVNPPTCRTALSGSDRDMAAETVTRLAILQPAGLMREYLQYTLPDILKPILQQHEQEKPILAAKAARRQILAKKYFWRWKANTFRRALNRRAKDRRQLRIDALAREKQKRMRGEAELEAILQAKKEKERIQAEMLARTTNESRSSISNGVQQTAGQKRKSMLIDRAEDFVNSKVPRKSAKSHHRSRTIGHIDPPFDPTKSLANKASPETTAPQFRSSIFSVQSITNGSRGSPDARPSLFGRKDTTRTDYFRLKALGIDPDTPIIPDTKASLERKRQREEEIATLASRTRARTLSSTARPSVPQFSLQEESVHEISGPSQSQMSTNAKTEATTSPATDSNEDDDLLRQVREVRRAITEGTDWFKKQVVNIEKDIEVQEELRRSASQGSKRSSPHPSATGLSMANGYKYLPGPEGPGRSLSRTEQRIRRTGAHGLATKPIGGSGDYLAVAMSRDSAAKLNVEKQSQQVSDVTHNRQKGRKSKRKTGEKDSRYIPQESNEDSDELEDDADSNGFNQSRMPHTYGKMRAIEMLHRTLAPDKQVADEYTGTEESDKDNIQETLGQSQRGQYEESEDGGDTEDLYEDGDDEEEVYDEDQQDRDEYGEYEEQEEGEEEEEADDVGQLPYRQGQQKDQGQTVGYWLRSSVTPERGLTPNGGSQLMSRVSSGMGTGTGASVDNALVLDSD